jgi:hypothetical protein
MHVTNDVGIIWLTPPAGATNLSVVDLSSYPAPYKSAVTITRRSDFYEQCNNTNMNSGVSMPVNPATQYNIMLFVKSGTNTTSKSINCTVGYEWQTSP